MRSWKLILCAFVWLDPGITPCCKTRRFFSGGLTCEFGRCLVRFPIEGVAASTLWWQRLTRRLSWASNWCWPGHGKDENVGAACATDRDIKGARDD
jgi:hypothetical protein